MKCVIFFALVVLSLALASPVKDAASPVKDAASPVKDAASPVEDAASPVEDAASSRGCIYIEGKCAYPCPEGTHDYGVGCDYIMPEATCKNPKPKLDTTSEICDYSSCYCDAPTVRDEKTNKCVSVDKCP